MELTPLINRKVKFDFHNHSMYIRKNESKKIRARYSDRIPIICESIDFSMKKIKYLVPVDLTMGHFLYVIRKYINDMRPEYAVFIFTEDQTLVPSGMLMSQIYEEYKNEDGFLYLFANKESTFG